MGDFLKDLALVVIGIALGALATGVVEWKLSHDQFETEQKNIAQALYVDISNTKDILDSSNRSFSNNTNMLDNPSMGIFDSRQYYNNNGLYYIFGRDISRLNSETSVDIYDFYTEVTRVENMNKYISKIVEKRESGENISQYEIAMVHIYSKGLHEVMIPYCIGLANKSLQDLRRNYDIELTSSPAIKIKYSPPETFNLPTGNLTFSDI